jgi:imidazolonepropionase-like amidohydrolase
MLRGAQLILCAASLGAQPIVIQTSTILDGRGGSSKDRQIVIEGSKIRSVAAGTAKAIYDLRGLTVMPGWIDTHIHLNWHLDANRKSVSNGGKPEDMALETAGDAYITLNGGFTTVQSVGAAIDANVRDIVARGLIPGPRILTSLRQIQQNAGEPDALRRLVRQLK